MSLQRSKRNISHPGKAVHEILYGLKNDTRLGDTPRQEGIILGLKECPRYLIAVTDEFYLQPLPKLVNKHRNTSIKNSIAQSPLKILPNTPQEPLSDIRVPPFNLFA